MACKKLKKIIVQRSRHLLIYLLALTFLLISCLSPISYMAQARFFIKHNETNVRRNDQEKEVGMMRQVIGSRPPRCGKRCKHCGHCEPVQVPIVPIKKSLGQNPRIAYSRGDDVSNYKPMCWKCKCGDFFFNPW